MKIIFLITRLWPILVPIYILLTIFFIKDKSKRKDFLLKSFIGFLIIMFTSMIIIFIHANMTAGVTYKPAELKDGKIIEGTVK